LESNVGVRQTRPSNIRSLLTLFEKHIGPQEIERKISQRNLGRATSYFMKLIRFSLSGRNWKKWEYNGTLHQLFIDFKNAYDSVIRKNYTILSLSLKYPENQLS
jgi:hypothetical protein